MRSLRPWILCTALGCFAAGMASGIVVREALASPPDAGSARDADYVRRFAAEFGLDERQERLLWEICASRRAREMEILGQAVVDDLPPALRSGIEEARRLQALRIRALLRPDQLARYEKASSEGDTKR
ncbi:MAG: hypothetical protein Fur0037_01080 [Planctomycetota bacterium]